MFGLLFLALVLFGVGQVDPRAAGLRALDQQDYGQAEQIFSKIASADPKDYSALFYLALAETGLKKDTHAVEHYKEVLVLKPGLYEAELNLGILYLRQHDAAAAVPLLREAITQKSTQARPKRYLGEALMATGDVLGAADAFQSALSIDAKSAPAELGLGQALAQEGKLDDAAAHYRNAATLDPALKSYLLELAVAYSKANRPTDALPFLKEFPDDPAAREEAGRILLAANRPAEAVIDFRAAATVSPTTANQMALATAYLRNNQPDLAAPLLDQALAKDPNDYDLRMVVGRIHRDKHDYLAAANQFLAAAQLRPQSVEAWNEAVNALVIAEQYPQALAALDKVRGLNAETAGDFYYRAIVLDKLHQVKPALECYDRFLQMSQGKYPDQEFIARQRSKILEKEARR